MKIVKGLAIFSFFSLILGSCFDPPEFPDTPQISFNKLLFIEVPDAPNLTTDTLNLTINFKDGDGNLGIPVDFLGNEPYHPINYFVGTSLSDTATVASTQYSDLPYRLLNINGSGKLVTYGKRRTSEFQNLPLYTFPYTCTAYVKDTIAVEQSDEQYIDGSFNIVDTLKFPQGQGLFYNVYIIADTFLIQTNPNYYNIEVNFYYRDPEDPDADNDGYVEFDWSTFNVNPSQGNCGENFDGAFPVLSDNNNALEGALTYSMVSVGFRRVFRNNVMRLKIQVKDRAFNRSNIITTPPFTLDEIKPR